MKYLLLILLVADGSAEIQTDSAGTVVTVQSNLNPADCYALSSRFLKGGQPLLPSCVSASELAHFLTRLGCVAVSQEQQPGPTFLPSDTPGGSTRRLELLRYACKENHL